MFITNEILESIFSYHTGKVNASIITHFFKDSLQPAKLARIKHRHPTNQSDEKQLKPNLS